MRTSERLDVIVIGGGQAGLAVGFHLRRTSLDWRILDAQEGPGGAWRHGWRSLRLFSPAQWSSLPGWLMPRRDDEYPTREEVLEYLAEYERRYALSIERPVRVHAVRAQSDALVLDTSSGVRRARAVVSATGTWDRPYIPAIDGRSHFRGEQLHSASYASPERFAGQRVLVVGGVNSGAQVLAEVSRVADATWVTLACTSQHGTSRHAEPRRIHRLLRIPCSPSGVRAMPRPIAVHPDVAHPLLPLAVLFQRAGARHVRPQREAQRRCRCRAHRFRG